MILKKRKAIDWILAIKDSTLRQFLLSEANEYLNEPVSSLSLAVTLTTRCGPDRRAQFDKICSDADKGLIALEL